MSLENIFRELAIASATKQAKLVNDFIKKAPIWAGVPMQEASHGLKNAFEKLGTVDAFKKLDGLDAPLPSVDVSSTLDYTDLSVFGGKMIVGEDKAKAFGGKEKYFATKLPLVIRQTASSFEKALIYQSLRPYAAELDNQISAGGATADSQYSLVCVKWEPGVTTGLYNPKGFGNGEVFDLMALNGGNLYDVKEDVPGYGMRVKGNFGLQLVDNNGASIVNIDLAADATKDSGFKALPTEAMIDDMIYSVEGDMSDTVIMGHPRVLGALAYYKRKALIMSPKDMSYPGQISDWGGIPLVGSYNFSFGKEAVVS